MNTLYLTGSSGGLGREIRAYFIERGWRVAGFDVFDDNFRHEQFLFFTIDSVSENSVEAAFSNAAKEFGAPRTLIATIGGLKPSAPFDEVTLDDLHFTLDINITSLFLTVKHALKLMKPISSGSIITIGAEPALHPEAKRAIYVGAKSAVVSMTQSIALETKEYGVNTNCIVPTVIHTKANESWGAPEDIPKWTEPRDIASLCHYLSSDEGKAVNGAIIRIPNGM
jgi:NAD(P)-dependent dehydrogenase (short-subunit alcohol dehydrogenase family)